MKNECYDYSDLSKLELKLLLELYENCCNCELASICEQFASIVSEAEVRGVEV